MIRLKRAYEPVEPEDGRRILVERLWPRGLSKDAAHLDAWLKDVAPSDGLRKWFHHDPRLWPGFEARYARELDAEPARPVVEDLARQAAHGTVTLVFAARDEEHNSAVVLKKTIERSLRRKPAKHARS